MYPLNRIILTLSFVIYCTALYAQSNIDKHCLSFASNQLLLNDSLIASGNKDSWFSRDKGLHFNGSMILTSGLANSMHRFSDSSKKNAVIWSAGCTLILGISKEIWDSRQIRNRFSLKDLAYNVGGIIIAGLVLQID